MLVYNLWPLNLTEFCDSLVDAPQPSETANSHFEIDLM